MKLQRMTLVSALLVLGLLSTSGTAMASDNSPSGPAESPSIATDATIKSVPESQLDPNQPAYVVGSEGEVLSTIEGKKQVEAAVTNRKSTQGPATKLVSGAEVESLAAGCAYRNGVALPDGQWHVSVDGCGIIGFNTSATWLYSCLVDITPYRSSNACTVARGYIRVGTYYKANWWDTGCGRGHTASVPIGNVATVAKMQFKAYGGVMPAYLLWK